MSFNLALILGETAHTTPDRPMDELARAGMPS